MTIVDLPTRWPIEEIIRSSGPAAEAFVARLAKWPPFRMRNVAVAFESALSAIDGPEVWLNASVTEFTFDATGNLSGATVRSLGGVRAVWWRYIFGRLLYPSKGAFTAHLVIEQMPTRDNRITLSDNATSRWAVACLRKSDASVPRPPRRRPIAWLKAASDSEQWVL
jgi:hypothetical protein